MKRLKKAIVPILITICTSGLILCVCSLIIYVRVGEVAHWSQLTCPIGGLTFGISYGILDTLDMSYWRK